MNSRSPKRIQKLVERGKPVVVGTLLLQTWFVVELCEESPESDRIFCDVVGVVREIVPNLAAKYRQTPMLVLTDNIRARSGLAFQNGRKRYADATAHIALKPIDFAHTIFGIWA